MTRICIVDDSLVVGKMLSKWLQQAGYQTTLFQNPLAALEHLKNLPARHLDVPHLLLVDVEMPGLGGPSLIQQLRQVPAYQHVPMVLLSANTQDRVPNHGVATAFLHKPVPMDALLACISSLVPPTNWLC